LVRPGVWLLPPQALSAAIETVARNNRNCRIAFLSKRIWRRTDSIDFKSGKLFAERTGNVSTGSAHRVCAGKEERALWYLAWNLSGDHAGAESSVVYHRKWCGVEYATPRLGGRKRWPPTADSGQAFVFGALRSLCPASSCYEILTETEADPSTHHPRTEKRSGPLSLRMTGFIFRDRIRYINRNGIPCELRLR